MLIDSIPIKTYKVEKSKKKGQKIDKCFQGFILSFQLHLFLSVEEFLENLMLYKGRHKIVYF